MQEWEYQPPPDIDDSMAETLQTVERCSDDMLRSMGARSLEIISAHGPDAWAQAAAEALDRAGLRGVDPPRN